MKSFLIAALILTGCAGKTKLDASNRTEVNGLMALEAVWAKNKSKKFDATYRVKNLSPDKTLKISSGYIACYAGEVQGEIAKNTMSSTRVDVKKSAPLFQKKAININVDVDNPDSRAKREANELEDSQSIVFQPGESKSFQLTCVLPDSLKEQRHINITNIRDASTGEVIIKEMALKVSSD